MDLKDLGLDLTDLQEQIVEAAAEKIIDNIGTGIETAVKKSVANKIDDKINKLIEETLGGIYQPIDDYGEAIGKKTTLRDQFKIACQKWWEQKVDSEGKQTGRYEERPRSEWVCQKVLRQILDHDMAKSFNNLLKETKEQMKTGIAEAIKNAISKTWGD